MASIAGSGAGRLLDLGCGVGFMIDIGRTRFRRINGVDATPAMAETRRSLGPAEIEVLRRRTSTTFAPDPGAYDVVTAYSFLHHLFEPTRAFEMAARRPAPGGIFYADLDPNQDFW